MPYLYGPDWPRRIDRREERGACLPADESPFEAAGQTLGSVLHAYEQQFQVRVWPYDGSIAAIPFAEGERPKYFFYQSVRDTSGFLVDIHIIREGRTFCAGQNLDLLLFPDDIVELGQLVC